MILAKRWCFWHMHCRRYMFLPQQKILWAQKNEMTPDFLPKNAQQDCQTMKNRSHPWRTFSFSAKITICLAFRVHLPNGNANFRFRELHLPHQKYLIPGFFKKKGKKQKCWDEKKQLCFLFASRIRWFCAMRYPFLVCARISEYVFCECDDTCGVRRSGRASTNGQKFKIPNPSPNLDRHTRFLLLFSHHATFDWPNHSLHIKLK
jgi:hypothetical protein